MDCDDADCEDAPECASDIIIVGPVMGPVLVVGWDDTHGIERDFYAGTLESLRATAYDHEVLRCGLISSPGELPVEDGSLYFLAVNPAETEASFGEDSRGQDRPGTPVGAHCP